MSEATQKLSNELNYTPADLAEIYALRKAYLKEIYPADQRLGNETYEEFVALWEKVPENLRQSALQNYRVGAKKAIAFTSEKLANVVIRNG